MESTDRAWAAGFLDGEGCFQIRRGSSKQPTNYLALVEVGQTDQRPLLRIQHLFGGRIAIRKQATARWATAYYWIILGLNAARMIEVVQPYLQLKNEQARVLLEFQATIPRRGHNPSIQPLELERRAKFKEQLQS